MAVSLHIRDAGIKFICVAYDLSTGATVSEIQGRFMNSEVSMNSFLIVLRDRFPVDAIKSIAVSTPKSLILPQHCDWMNSFLKISNRYLYFTKIRFISFLQESCVACLRNGKNSGKIYTKGEKALFLLGFKGVNAVKYLSIYLLEKIDLGWKFVKSVVNPIDDDDPESILEECIEELATNMDEIKHVFARIFNDQALLMAITDHFGDVTCFLEGSPLLKEEILNAGKYLSMIYAKTGDYDCYVPHVLEQKLNLHVGNQIIPLPIQFKPFPYNLSVKITLEEGVNNLELYSSSSIIPSNFSPIRTIPYNREERNIIFKMHTNIAYQISFSVELDNKERQLIEESSSKMVEHDGYPHLFLSAINAFWGTYYKNGLQFSIEGDDEDDNVIPAVVNFSKSPPLIGEAALQEDGTKCWLYQTMLMDGYEMNFYGERSPGMNLIKDEEDNENKLIIKIGNEWRKMRVETLFAVFLKSMLKLLKEKMDDEFDTIWFNFTIKEVYNYPTTKRLLDMMDIKFVHKITEDDSESDTDDG